MIRSGSFLSIRMALLSSLVMLDCGGLALLSRLTIRTRESMATCCVAFFMSGWTAATISLTGMDFGVGANFRPFARTFFCGLLSCLDERLMTHFSECNVIPPLSRSCIKVSNFRFCLSLALCFSFSDTNLRRDSNDCRSCGCRTLIS